MSFVSALRFTIKSCAASWAVLALTSLPAVAADTVQVIGVDWTPVGRIPYRVAALRSSGTLGGDSGTYASSKAVDGDRQTKWVASNEPSEKEPQWLELELGSPRKVAAVAVFGQRPDNDGILSARVQASTSKVDSQAFEDVASVERLSSEAWLVTFAPVQTDRVRLVITKSGPPSPHTDVHEVVVLSPELGPDELEEYLRGELQKTLADLESLKPKIDGLNRLDPLIASSLKNRIQRLQADAHEISRESDACDAYGDSAVTSLSSRADAIARGVWSLQNLLSESLHMLRDHVEELRRSTKTPLSPDQQSVSLKFEDDRYVVANRDLVLEIDRKTGTWNCTWRQTELAGLRNVGFQVDVNGQTTLLIGGSSDVSAFEDELGTGTEIVHRIGEAIPVERRLRVYDDQAAVVVSARITNDTDGDITLNSANLIDVASDADGWWQVGAAIESPGSVRVQGSSELVCDPPGLEGDGAQKIASCGMIDFGFRDPTAAFVVGFLSAQHARPSVNATFQPGEGGLELRAQLPFYGLRLQPRESIDLDPVYLAVDNDPYTALEAYGDAVAALSASPPRTQPTSLWCSWYAHRLAMTEDLVLANAAVAARHFKPLGMEIVQLDHGWQRGDVDGDWVVNEKFPHGLKWLADELWTRHKLKLGAWIAPVDLAETSETFNKHPNWALMDEEGRPKTSGRWFWEPNPMCYVLDASQPDAERFIEETFAKLTADGVRYFKIDFIAICGSEGFRQHDPYTVRGWGVLKRAMDAIRRGAGPDAWIRYCQTPPWLSVGLADGTVGGADTSDSGVPTVINTLRTNARSMAAGYWLHNRLYHREVCDMSVGMRGPLWEARMKLAMMALGGTSVSFSDELTYLPPSRIRMMQQCLPAGGPAMRPLDLFERKIPSLWHIHCKNRADEWDVVGVFNFEDEQQTFHIEMDRLGFDKAEKATVFEFWDERFVGVEHGRFDVHLAPRETQILIIRKLQDRPFVVATDMHALGGFHELVEVEWDGAENTLSGRFRRAPEMNGRAYIYVPPGFEPRSTFPLSDQAARLTNVGNGLWMQEIHFDKPEFSWSIPFSHSAAPPQAIEPIE